MRPRTLAKDWLCACRAKNGDAHDRCEGCGAVRPRALLRPSRLGPGAVHVCAPDPETGVCLCGRRVVTDEEGKRLARAAKAALGQ